MYTTVTTLDDEMDLTNNTVSLREAVYMASEYTEITFAEGLIGTVYLDPVFGQLCIDKGLKIPVYAVLSGDGFLFGTADVATRRLASQLSAYRLPFKRSAGQRKPSFSSRVFRPQSQ